MSKKVVERFGSESGHWVGDGFPVRSLFSYHEHGARVSPFLLLDFTGPHVFEPNGKRRGVGQHPHRGFETVSIVYEGELEHRDSAGNGGVIGPGDVQWMTAGSGIIHEEYHSAAFGAKGGPLLGIQLWVNLPASDKMAPPAYQGITAARIPSVDLADGAGTARVIAGDLDGVEGPARTFTPINLWDVQLEARGRTRMAVPADHNAFVIVMKGEVEIGDDGAFGQAHGARLDGENADIVLGSPSGARILVLTGEPIDEPIVGYGPFVMNSREEIAQAVDDFNDGRFLSPVA